MNISKLVAAVSVTGLLSGLAACAPTDGATTGASPARQCFNIDMVNGFSSPDRDTMLLNVGANRTFKVETNGFCHDLDNAISIGIRPDLGSSRVCTGDWARVIVPNSMHPASPCRVRVIGEVAKEVAAEQAAED